MGKQEDRLAKATLELAGACLRADGAVRKRTELENGESANEESIDSLDKQLAESKFTLAASESKFDDISRKLATLEADATRGNERAEVAEMNIQRLNVRIDQVEEDLLAEKYKIKKISDDLNQTFEDMINMSV